MNMNTILTDTRKKIIAGPLTDAVNTLLDAKLIAQVEREKMDKLDAELLQRFEIFTSSRWANGGPRSMPVRRITKEKDLYLADQDSEVMTDYYKARREGIAALGYKVEGDTCPALVAENLVMDARAEVVKVAGPMFGLGADPVQRLMCAGMDKYDEFIDLCMKLVVSFPGYRNPTLEMLKKNGTPAAVVAAV